MTQNAINPLSFTPLYHFCVEAGAWQLHESFRASRAALFFNLAMDEARKIKSEGHSVRLSPVQQLASEIDCVRSMDIWGLTMEKPSPQELMQQTIRLKPDKVYLGSKDYFFLKKKNRKFRQKKLTLMRTKPLGFPTL